MFSGIRLHRSIGLAVFAFTLAALPIWAETPSVVKDISAAKAYHMVDRSLVLSDEGASGLIAVDRVELASGEVRESGERLLPGDVVVRGILVNRQQSALALMLDDGRALRVGGSDLVMVGDAVAPGLVKSCSVSCGPGYYACCSANLYSPSCVCYPDGSIHLCDSGGPGSTNCGLGTSP